MFEDIFLNLHFFIVICNKGYFLVFKMLHIFHFLVMHFLRIVAE
jgi:hypothetical protein